MKAECGIVVVTFGGDWMYRQTNLFLYGARDGLTGVLYCSEICKSVNGYCRHRVS